MKNFFMGEWFSDLCMLECILNELEFWRGRILANVWYEDVILVIHPDPGIVEKEYGTCGFFERSTDQSVVESSKTKVLINFVTFHNGVCTICDFCLVF